MIVSRPISLSDYGDAYVVARSHGPLELAASGPSADEARETLRERLAEHLGRLHPRRLASIDRSLDVEHARLSAPLYRDCSSSSSDSGDEARLSVPLDVWIERVSPTFERLASPLFERPIWSRVRSDRRTSDPSRWPNLEAWIERVRRDASALERRRPIPRAVSMETIEVECEPADFQRLDDEQFQALSIDEPLPSTGPDLYEAMYTWARPRSCASLEAPPSDAGFAHDDALQTMRALVSSDPPSPVVLVGPSRVGKSTLVRYLGATWGEHEAGPDRIWRADVSRWRSDDDTEIGGLIAALGDSGDLLHIGDLGDVAALEAEGYTSVRRLLSALDDRRIRIVAEATPDTWQRLESQAPDWTRVLEVVRVREPDEAGGERLVSRGAERLGASHGVAWTDGALERLWGLYRRFAAQTSPVGAALDFAARLVERARIEHVSEVTADRIAETFCDETGLPTALVRSDRSLDLDSVREALGTRVVGQAEAVRRVADVVGVAQAELGARDRPFGTFVFVGPTGVGKTELARALADHLFGDESRLVRLDMSEYGQPDDYRRLVGEHGGEGTLTAPVRREPFSIVLLDEIEKAHDHVFDLLLQVLGEARLTDADGRTTRFHNAIVVMTSNLGIAEAGAEADPEVFLEAVEDHFRPEFLGRLDRIVPFHPLSRETIRTIARRQVARLAERSGLVERNVGLEVDDDVLDRLAELGWSERYGARPIRRVVEQRVVASLARRLSTIELVDDRRYRACAALDASNEIDWQIERVSEEDEEDDEEPSRRGDDRLLVLLEEASDLRRRIRACTESPRFEALACKLESYERASQSDDFWQREGAAEQAQRAERLRELIEPAREMADELEAIEELAREAFHSRADELTDEIESHLQTFRPEVDSIVHDVIRTALDRPDEIVLLFPADEPESEWRDQLVAWYRQLARGRGWSAQLWQGIPPGERDRKIGIADEFRHGELWRTQRSPHGRVVALQYRGPAVRAYLRAEGGRHRLLRAEGVDTTELHVLESDRDWPHPDVFQFSDPLRQTARTWNLRDGVAETLDEPTVELDSDRPWRELFEILESRARRLLDEGEGADETGDDAGESDAQ
jgi:MoxR-like ATPase